MKKSKKIFAIVGMCGSGKSEVVKYLQEKYRWPKIYLPATLFEEIEKRGMETNWKNEELMRKKLREEEGVGVFAKLALSKIKKELENGEVIILESLYSWTEYRIIKKAYPDYFKVIAVVASVQEWEGSVDNELLIYAKVTGEPIEVVAKFGSKRFDLQKLQEEKYMKLALLDNLAIEDENTEIMISALVAEGKEISYIIPREQYSDLFKKSSSSALMTTIVNDESGSIKNKESLGISFQKIILVGTTLICIILIVNVWILEREEERLVHICKYPEGLPTA